MALFEPLLTGCVVAFFFGIILGTTETLTCTLVLVLVLCITWVPFYMLEYDIYNIILLLYIMGHI